MIDIVIQNPIIAAIRDPINLNKCILSKCKVIFLLHTNILTINNEINLIKKANKYVFVHIDLIEGLGKDEKAVDYLNILGADGIISTRNNLISYAKQIGLKTIHRIFLLDSMSILSGIKLVQNSQPDFVEVLPGVIPKAINNISKVVEIPIIAGGMIETKEEVISALSSGAVAVSTSNISLFNL